MNKTYSRISQGNFPRISKKTVAGLFSVLLLLPGFFQCKDYREPLIIATDNNNLTIDFVFIILPLTFHKSEGCHETMGFIRRN